MNMISTGSFLTEMDASNKQSALLKKLTTAWEKKNSKAARAGGASLMALSLAACGSGDDEDGYALNGTTYPTLTAVAESDNATVRADATADATDGRNGGSVYGRHCSGRGRALLKACRRARRTFPKIKNWDKK